MDVEERALMLHARVNAHSLLIFELASAISDLGNETRERLISSLQNLERGQRAKNEASEQIGEIRALVETLEEQYKATRDPTRPRS